MVTYYSRYKNQGTNTVNFYFILTQNCGLTCSFCYQPGAFRRTDKEMTWETAEKALKFAIKTFPEERLKFVFYGGEPLLRFDIIKKMVTTYPQLRYTLVTNGLLITDEIRDFLIENSSIVYTSISISNAKDCYPDTWKGMVGKALEVLQATKSDIHCVLSNPHDVYDTYLWLEQNVPGLIRLDIPRWGAKYQQADYEEYFNQFKKVCDRVYFGEKFTPDRLNFDRAFVSNINPRSDKNSIGAPFYCGAGVLYIMVNADGEIYPCDYFCALKALKMGTLDTGLDQEVIDKVLNYKENPIRELYTYCDEYRQKGICSIPDVKYCPRAMCIGENLEHNKEMEKPLLSHCMSNNVEYRIYKYILDRSAETGIINKVELK